MTVSPALRRGIRSCLADLDEITTLYVSQVRTLTGYVESVIAERDVHSTAFTTLGLMFRQLGGERLEDELRAHSRAIGRKRVRQGVPLESLLRAVRMDFRFIWQALNDRLPGEADRLSDDVVAIWEVVEAHTTSVQSGYMLELGQVKAELEQEQAFLLRRLLRGGVDDSQLHVQAAEALEIPLTGPYWVAVAHQDAAAGFAADVQDVFPAAVCLRLDGVEFAVIAGTSDVAGVVGSSGPSGPSGSSGSSGPFGSSSSGRSGSSGVLVQLALADLQVGVSQSAATLSSLSEMWQLASELAEFAVPGRAAVLAQHWPSLVVRRLGPVASSLAADALRDFALLPSSERDLLVEAVEVYMASGSASKAAGVLFCHRNTIMNRLAKFASVAGLDPTVPDDAATIKVVLAAARGAEVGRP
ncbi:helix-turn-helix domain-containing protein [Pseudoclavibacter sp. VKM Ac-2888]|uniref:helix-turn-helix domain-containing protein n=1 Tax=Pseudoclavibacter sp. VKM Ac-2888 TaxID=2783830 RepID=UPI00188B3562|nr:helix-turn-helix domain-containing protein [Pseudoclavibacter sp. VKM Ac-2888]MBF4552087.1 helix-turn-helix domain-containing protein [Pseudoclavibacter sp. VKM Ac-2888]